MAEDGAQGKSIPVSECYRMYAERLEGDAGTLTVVQRKQAFLNAMLAGFRVEPFATWCDIGDAIIARISPGTQTLNQLIQETDQ